MRFCVINLGCRVNRVESDSIIQAYLARGGELVSAAYAEIIVVNTCTVTGEAEKKTRKAIHRALRANQNAKVIVTGCASNIDPEGYAALDPRVVIVDKMDLLEVPVDAPARVGESFPVRVGIKIQDGCDHACTFCIVHVARGKAWSRPSDEIVAEVCALEDAGVREIVMTGIDLGSYDEPIPGRSEAGGMVPTLSDIADADACQEGQKRDLAWLLRLLLARTKECRFRISSIEPISVTDELIELMARSNGRICEHLHLPLQSGSSKVLSEMERPYDATFFRDLVDKLRAAMPNISLTTDLMVAFPGETEEDFQESLGLARYARFSKIHVFRYSKRAGTPAALRADQVPPEVSERRARELRELSFELHQNFGQSLVGTTELVAVEGEGIGMTSSFYRVRVSSDLEAGSLVPLRLTELDASGIFSSC